MANWGDSRLSSYFWDRIAHTCSACNGSGFERSWDSWNCAEIIEDCSQCKGSKLDPNQQHDAAVSEAERQMLYWSCRLDKLMGRETTQVDVLKRALREACEIAIALRGHVRFDKRHDARIAELRKLAE